MGQRIDYVYFPSNAMISLVTQMRNGTIVEVGLMGVGSLIALVQAIKAQKI